MTLCSKWQDMITSTSSLTRYSAESWHWLSTAPRDDVLTQKVLICTTHENVQYKIHRNVQFPSVVSFIKENNKSYLMQKVSISMVVLHLLKCAISWLHIRCMQTLEWSCDWCDLPLAAILSGDKQTWISGTATISLTVLRHAHLMTVFGHVMYNCLNIDIHENFWPCSIIIPWRTQWTSLGQWTTCRAAMLSNQYHINRLTAARLTNVSKHLACIRIVPCRQYMLSHLWGNFLRTSDLACWNGSVHCSLLFVYVRLLINPCEFIFHTMAFQQLIWWSTVNWSQWDQIIGQTNEWPIKKTKWQLKVINMY